MATSAQDENALVERVFLRIGSAESDEQLQTALGKFLAPLLLKLNSSDEVVRSKVLKLLAHIKMRLKSRSQVRVPLDALLTQFQDPEATPFITNFTILFIKMGFPRIDPDKQAELVPLLINCLEGRSTNHQNSLLQLIIPALDHVKIPKTDAEAQSQFALKDKPAIKQLLMEYFMDLLLLPYNFHVSAIPPPSGEVGAAEVQPPTVPPPPGLSLSAFNRLTAENPLSPEALERAKLRILTLLGSGVVEEEEAVCHYVIGSSDTRHSVATSADMELKRITGSIDWNSKEILSKLYSIFQGTIIIKGQSAVKPEHRRSAVGPRIRHKIFPIFLKAREASNMFPSCLQIVFDCLFGASPNPKLRMMAVQFVHHICLNCEEAKFAMFDVVLLNGMLKVIKEASEDSKLRGLAYVAVGKIGQRSPHRLTKDIQIVQTFFDAMCQESGDTRLAVQEALAMMADAFRNLDGPNKLLMEALLLQNIDKEEFQARVVTIQYAAAVFPSNHIPSRYILMLGAGDIKDDVRLESVKALRGTRTKHIPGKDQEKRILPNFVEMINYVVDKARLRKESRYRYSSGNSVLPFNPATYNEVVMYLRMCLAQAAELEVEWDVQSLPEQAPVIAKHVKKLLEEEGDATNGSIQQYVHMLQELLEVTADGEAMYCLLEIVAIVPDVLAHQFKPHLSWLKSLLSSSKDDIKQHAAQLYAIVSFHSASPSDLLNDVDHFHGLLKDKNPELTLGALLTLGYMIGLKRRAQRTIGDKNMETAQDVKDADILSKCVKSIVALLYENNVSVKSAACLALGEIGRNGSLPVPAGSDVLTEADEKEKEKEGREGCESPSGAQKNAEEATKISVVRGLIAMIKTSNESLKTKEKAALCLGNIVVGEEDFPHRRIAIQELFNSVTSKQMELQFTIGQCLVNVAMGATSPQARCVWNTSKEEHKKNVAGMKDDVAWFLEEMLNKYICHANPHLRQGACIWLLTLIRQAGTHSAIQGNLLSIQRGFMRLLSENDEMTQDMASKGLGQVMEVCSAEQKDTLVSELVDTLMTGKSAKNEVSGDTTVFQSGALGSAPDGGGMSTYKELCAIATDLNQPDLIYKFMHLANHNASWNVRKGAAFGFSTIAAQAGEQLAPYLTQIVPRLYRYQFDPNPKIQQAMSSIWNALVQDNKKTMDTYLKQILADLLKNLTSNQWRVRESSCLAVSDLLRGRVLDDIVEDIPALWEVCLRVRDDIKETVRIAADSACKTLSKVSVKICDVSNGKIGQKATQLVLPCLLQCSLQSSVSEVRAIGLSTILQISRNAGVLLKPNIPVLVTALLEAVSGLEPQVMNYLSLHTGSQATQEKLDSARIAASKMSPMMETVNRCVQYVDSEILPELIPRLVELIRGGIGVSTKAGCSSFVVSLTHQCPKDLTPFAGKLMAAFLHGLGDRNATVRKAYATALGHLAKIGKDSSVEKLITKLKTWYLESEDPNTHHACSVTLHAISRHSSDCLRRHAQLAMPLAFFAMHEEQVKEGEMKKSEETSEWEDVWNEITPGTEVGIRLYLSEIVTLLSTCLQSQAWSVKAQSGRAMATVATKLGQQLGPPHLGDLLTALLDALSGRTWTGKESLLKALTAVCTSCKQEIIKGGGESSNQPSIDQILTVILRECGKEQRAYKIAAMKCVGPILELYELDRFKAMWEITQSIVSSVTTKPAEEDDTSVDQKQELIQCAFTVLGEAWPHDKDTQEEFRAQFMEVLCTSMPLCTWKVQVILLKDMNKLLSRLHIFQEHHLANNSDKIKEICNKILASSLEALGNSKYVSLRSESLAAIDTIVQRLSAIQHLHLLPLDSLRKLEEELKPLAESGPWELRDRAKTLVRLVSGPSISGDNVPQPMET